MLVSLGGCEPQVKGHVAANVNVGNDRARLLDVLTQLIPFIGYPRTLNGLRVLDAGDVVTTVLVVGATGSIGRLVVEEAIRQGYRTRALVRDRDKARTLPLGCGRGRR